MLAIFRRVITVRNGNMKFRIEDLFNVVVFIQPRRFYQEICMAGSSRFLKDSLKIATLAISYDTEKTE